MWICPTPRHPQGCVHVKCCSIEVTLFIISEDLLYQFMAIWRSGLRKMVTLDEENQYYKIEIDKPSIKMKIPIKIAKFVLDYAKLSLKLKLLLHAKK